MPGAWHMHALLSSSAAAAGARAMAASCSGIGRWRPLCSLSPLKNMSASPPCPSAPRLARGCAAARPQRAVGRTSSCNVHITQRAARSQAQSGERATAVAPSPPPPQQQVGSSSSGGSRGSPLSDAHTLTEQQHSQQQRRLQLAAAAAGLGGLSAAVYAALSAQPQLPPLSEVAGPAAATVLGAPLLALLAAKTVLRDQLHLELHRWAGARQGGWWLVTGCAAGLLLLFCPCHPPCCHLQEVPRLSDASARISLMTQAMRYCHTQLQGQAVPHCWCALARPAGGARSDCRAPHWRRPSRQRRIRSSTHTQGHVPWGLHWGASGPSGLLPALPRWSGGLQGQLWGGG